MVVAPRGLGASQPTRWCWGMVRGLGVKLCGPVGEEAIGHYRMRGQLTISPSAIWHPQGFNKQTNKQKNQERNVEDAVKVAHDLSLMGRHFLCILKE